MVHPRRSHARPTRRRNVAGTVLAVAMFFCASYTWHHFSSFPSSPRLAPVTPASAPAFDSTSAPNSHSVALSSPSRLGVPDLVLPQSTLMMSGSTPWWLDPSRNFDAEYEDILLAMPELRGKRRARIAFLIMAHGPKDVQLLKRSLPWLYSPLNFFLVHMDVKSSDKDRAEVRGLLEGLDNARMLEPALSVSWGGFSITLTALFGLSTLVEWSPDWDYFINLSASDFPLMTSTEMGVVMGTFVDSRVNFIAGSAMMEQNRAELYVDDQGLYRVNETRKAAQPFLQRGTGRRVERPLPTLFSLFKGEFWVALHRDFAEYVHESPDNVARSLQAYFAKFRISDESFFQTTICHPDAPNAFPVYNDNLRLINWPYFDPETEWVLHPDPVEPEHVAKLMKSGALFARKFELGTSDQAWSNIEKILEMKGSEMANRMHRVLERGKPARSVTGRNTFCQVPQGYNLNYVLRHQKIKTERKSPDHR